MAQQQQVVQLTINNLGAAITALTPAQANIYLSDAIWSNADLALVVGTLSAIPNRDLAGATNAQALHCLAEFAINAAQLYANNKTNFRTSAVTAQGMAQACSYNSIRDAINKHNLSIARLCATFATDIYNTMCRTGKMPLKWFDKGFTQDTQAVAFPGSSHIDVSKADPPLTNAMMVAALANKKANIYEATPPTQMASIHNHFSGGVVLNARPPPPGRLAIGT